MKNLSLTGYRRENGRIGVRNYVVVIPADVSNAAAEGVSHLIRDVMALPHPYGLLQFGADLFGSQPTEGNIRGGLSTIEEKAMGNIQKMSRNKVASVLKPAQEPQGPGLHFMDSSSAAAEMVTLCAAGGSILHFFTTGQGNIIGHPIRSA